MEFIIPMPKSWPASKKLKMDGSAHQQTPDIDNLEKGILDSLFVDDKKVHKVMASKIWGYNGKVLIKNWHHMY
jgi:Holliday junction resolvase RusA-like endonuclease